MTNQNNRYRRHNDEENAGKTTFSPAAEIIDVISHGTSSPFYSTIHDDSCYSSDSQHSENDSELAGSNAEDVFDKKVDSFEQELKHLDELEESLANELQNLEKFLESTKSPTESRNDTNGDLSPQDDWVQSHQSSQNDAKQKRRSLQYGQECVSDSPEETRKGTQALNAAPDLLFTSGVDGNHTHKKMSSLAKALSQNSRQSEADLRQKDISVTRPTSHEGRREIGADEIEMDEFESDELALRVRRSFNGASSRSERSSEVENFDIREDRFVSESSNVLSKTRNIMPKVDGVIAPTSPDRKYSAGKKDNERSHSSRGVSSHSSSRKKSSSDLSSISSPCTVHVRRSSSFSDGTFSEEISQTYSNPAKKYLNKEHKSKISSNANATVEEESYFDKSNVTCPKNSMQQRNTHRGMKTPKHGAEPIGHRSNSSFMDQKGKARATRPRRKPNRVDSNIGNGVSKVPDKKAGRGGYLLSRSAEKPEKNRLGRGFETKNSLARAGSFETSNEDIGKHKIRGVASQNSYEYSTPKSSKHVQVIRAPFEGRGRRARARWARERRERLMDESNTDKNIFDTNHESIARV